MLIMKNIRWLLFVTLCFTRGYTFSQDVSLELQKQLKLSAQAVNESWNNMPLKTMVGFGTSSIRYPNEIPPSGPLAQTWKASRWKHEKVHAQILVAAKEPINSLKIEAGPLVDKMGNIIAKENISTGFVQNVMTYKFRNGCAYRKSTDFDTSEVADIINTQLNRIAVAARTTRPVWVSVQIPQNIPAGIYTGALNIKADKKYELRVTINVTDRKLTGPDEWTFRLDYWQHPAATDMDGFLRWAYNSWPQHPLTDSRFTAWPAGDTYQVYHGPLSSIRFEKLIEGIRDFEKIKILLKQYTEKNQTEKFQELQNALKIFSIHSLSKYSAQETVTKFKHLLT